VRQRRSATVTLEVTKGGGTVIVSVRPLICPSRM
jgi:hypothetical protein